MKIRKLFLMHSFLAAALLAVITLFSSTNSARATLIANEPFNFTGTALLGNGSGTGWGANLWTGGTIAMPNDGTSLVYPAGSAFAVTGQRIKATAASTTATRIMTTSFTVSANYHYISFLATKTSTGAFRIELNNSTGTQQRWGVKVNADGSVAPGAGGGTGAVTYWPASAAGLFANNTTYLVVCKIASGITSYVKLFKNGDVIPTSDTGLSWDVTSSPGASGVAADRIQIIPTAGTVEIDELYVGTTWADVVGKITKADNTDALNLTTSWSGGVVPGANVIPVWNNTVTTANAASLGADTTWAGMVVQNPGGLVTINAGNTLTLGAAATAIDMSAATADLTLNCPLIMGADNIWNVAASRTLTLGSVVSGATNVTKLGTGTATLSAANTYTGNTTISAGKLALGASGSLPASSSVSIASGATFDVSAQATYTHGASASLTATGTATVPAVIAGGTTVNLGSRPVTLNYKPDTFTGDANSQALSISSGSLNINSAITVVNNGTSALGNGTYVVIRVVGGSSTGTPTLSGVVGGLGIVSTKTAYIQRNGGTGDIELVVADGLPATIALTRHSGTVDNSTYGNALQFDVTVTGAGPTPTGTVELRDGSPTGTLLGSGSLAGGTVTIAPALNAITGGAHTLYAVYLGDPNYAVGNNTLSQTVVALPVTVTGGSARNKVFDGTTTATVTGATVVTPVTGDTATEINANGGTFANVGPGTGISVTVVLGGTKASSYSLTSSPALTANINTTGIWTNTLGGTWSTAGNWADNAVGTGTNVTADFNSINLTADTTVTNDTARTIGNLIFGDADTSSAASWVVVSNTITLAGTDPTITVNPLGTGAKVTINSLLTGANGLTKNGTGTLTLGGLNSYTGGLTVNNGTLIFPGSVANTFTGGVTNNDGSLVISNMNSVGCAGGSSSSSNSINLNGGTFSYAGGTLASDTLTFNLLGGTSTIDISGDAQTLRGGAAVVGPGNLVKTGLGTLSFGKNSITTLGNTFTGNILVTGGQMDIRNPDSLGDVAGSTTISNATLSINPFGQAWGVTFSPEPLEFFGNSYIRNYDQSATVAQVNTLTGPMTNNGTLSIFSQTSGAYAELDINGDLTNTAGSSLVLGGVAIGITGTSTNGQIITINGVVHGPASVSAVGDSTSVYILANNNYSGNTTVSGGTLKLALATLATNSTVTVTTNAVLQLDFTGITNTIGTLVLNGVTQPVGVYDSINGAPYITGSGSLQVVYSAPPLSTNAHLTSLAITPAGTLSPAFAFNVTTYAATNAYVASPTVTVVNADLTATNHLIFNGATNLLASGVASSPLSLTLGVNNPVVVQVTAQDGVTVKTYTVNVTRQPSLTSAMLSNSVSGSTLTLSWPADHLGYSLQAQTNSLNSGLGTNWVTLPGSTSVTTTNLPINNVNPTVFYRLVYP